jgi:hypothetical protein
MVLNRADEGRESTCITEGALLDFFEDSGEIRVEGVRAVVMGMTEILNVFSEVTEEEDVVLANFTSDFNLIN